MSYYYRCDNCRIEFENSEPNTICPRCQDGYIREVSDSPTSDHLPLEAKVELLERRINALEEKVNE